jgi:hypothetical protein
MILAVSLALMALLVATASGSRRGAPHGHVLTPAAASGSHRTAGHVGGTSATSGTRGITALPATTTTTSDTSPGPAPTGAASSATPSLAAHTSSTSAGTAAPSETTTTLAPTTTTTTTTAAVVPADRTQTEGYLDPPVQTSNQYGFTGAGPMQISVLWSGATYLTMTVSCPNGSQSVGGTGAMEATLPSASGSCLARVSEPASETVALTYTITIGPAGG